MPRPLQCKKISRQQRTPVTAEEAPSSDLTALAIPECSNLLEGTNFYQTQPLCQTHLKVVPIPALSTRLPAFPSSLRLSQTQNGSRFEPLVNSQAALHPSLHSQTPLGSNAHLSQARQKWQPQVLWPFSQLSRATAALEGTNFYQTK